MYKPSTVGRVRPRDLIVIGSNFPSHIRSLFFKKKKKSNIDYIYIVSFSQRLLTIMESLLLTLFSLFPTGVKKERKENEKARAILVELPGCHHDNHYTLTTTLEK